MKHFKCTTPQALYSAIGCELHKAGVANGESFAVLVEGNDLGDFYITTLNREQLAACIADGDSVSDMQDYGYRFYNRISDIAFVVSDFFTPNRFAI